MPDPFGFVVKNGTNRFDVSGSPLPSSSTFSSNQSPVVFQPIDDAAAGLERRVDGVADDVDEQLLELIGVGDEPDVGRRLHGDRQALLELDDAVDQLGHAERLRAAASAGARAARRRAGTGRARPTVPRSATAPAALRRCAGTRSRDRRCAERVRDRLDRRERVVDLVRQHAHDALPRRLLFFAQRLAQVGHDDEMMRPAVAIEHARAALRSGRGVRRTTRSTSRRGSPLRYSSKPSVGRRLADELLARLADQLLGGLVDEQQLVVRDRTRRPRRAISSITCVRSAVDSTASVRWRCSVEPRSLTSRMTIAIELPLLARQAANRVVAFAQRAEQVGDQVERAHRQLARRRRRDDPHAERRSRRASSAPLADAVLPDEVDTPPATTAGRRAAEHEQRQRQLEVARARRAAAGRKAIGHVLQPELLQPPVQRAAAHAELLGGLAHVAAVTREHFLDEDLLRLLERHLLGRRRRRRPAPAVRDRPP